MYLIENFPLKYLNSFHTDVYAKFFTTINDTDELVEFYSDTNNLQLPVLILGGGNNILFTKNFEGIVLKIGIKGIETIKEEAGYVYVKAAAGEDWDDFVSWCVQENLGGIENLSLIPGQVGSSPIQNIGAYGSEVKNSIAEVYAYNIKTAQVEIFPNEACAFGYRTSIFKTTYKDTHVITAVTFRLSKNPVIDNTYEAVNTELQLQGIATPTVADMRRIICQIRKSKLPDTNVLGNAGSFFKNPEMGKTIYDKLKEQYPDLIGYTLENGNVKLAAGWLIEKSGWKGFREGDAGVHDKQALVLVNHGKATGTQILTLAEKIKNSVQKMFEVNLEYEVNIM